ncbi:hypothetical protein ACWC1C_01200 [Streptomyces sp. NPDC001705]
MKSEYVKGWIKLNSGKCVDARFHRDANRECARTKRCVCGFCKGVGQCGLADCHNAIPVAGEATPLGVVVEPGNICVSCEGQWAARMPGHRRSTFAKRDDVHGEA